MYGSSCVLSLIVYILKKKEYSLMWFKWGTQVEKLGLKYNKAEEALKKLKNVL